MVELNDENIAAILLQADNKALMDCHEVWSRFFGDAPGKGAPRPVLAVLLECYKSGRLRQIQENDLAEPINGA